MLLGYYLVIWVCSGLYVVVLILTVVRNTRALPRWLIGELILGASGQDFVPEVVQWLFLCGSLFARAFYGPFDMRHSTVSFLIP